MPKISDMYGGKYLVGANVPKTPQEFQITEVAVNEKMGKVCLTLDGTDRQLALNKTNATEIAETLGDDTDEWLGGWITIRQGKTLYQGKSVACVTVCGVRTDKQHSNGVELTDHSQES